MSELWSPPTPRGEEAASGRMKRNRESQSERGWWAEEVPFPLSPDLMLLGSTQGSNHQRGLAHGHFSERMDYFLSLLKMHWKLKGWLPPWYLQWQFLEIPRMMSRRQRVGKELWGVRKKHCVCLWPAEAQVHMEDPVRGRRPYLLHPQFLCCRLQGRQIIRPYCSVLLALLSAVEGLVRILPQELFLPSLYPARHTVP